MRGGSSGDAATLAFVFGDFVVEGAAADAEGFRGRGAVAAASAEGAEDGFSFDDGEGLGGVGFGIRGGGGWGAGRVQAEAGSADGLFELAQVAGFGEELGDVVADGLLGGVQVAEAGDDDDGGGGAVSAEVFEEGHAVGDGEVEVQQEEIGRIGVNLAKGLARGGRGHRGAIHASHNLGEEIAEAGFVFEDEGGGGHERN